MEQHFPVKEDLVGFQVKQVPFELVTYTYLILMLDDGKSYFAVSLDCMQKKDYLLVIQKILQIADHSAHMVYVPNETRMHFLSIFHRIASPKKAHRWLCFFETIISLLIPSFIGCFQ